MTVNLYDTTWNSEMRKRVEKLAINYHASKSKAKLLNVIFYYLKVLRKIGEKDLIIHTTTRYTAAYVGLLRLMGMHDSSTYWINHEHMVAPSSKVIKFIYSKLVMNSNVTIYSSHTCKKSYNLKTIPKKSFISNVSSISQMPTSGKDDERIKRVTSLLRASNDKNTRLLLYCGRIREDKGIFRLVEKLKTEKNASNNYYLLIILGSGNPTDLNILKSKIGDSSNIYYMGSAQMSKRIYAEFDIGITPSDRFRESLGLSGLEQAVYIGNALIASKTDCYDYLYKYDGFHKYDPWLNIYKQLENAIYGNRTSPKEIIDIINRDCMKMEDIINYILVDSRK
ncbi:glycosyltransferase [Synechococcus sp. TAK9802]|uniref:glycosyltransferase n=1 Tax=Synechococcus sp. TAK9802 TaxID=1442558 RepID=UPI001644824C|nr:glycosyltransferase [Synechococcus sp. TAK9802]